MWVLKMINLELAGVASFPCVIIIACYGLGPNSTNICKGVTQSGVLYSRKVDSRVRRQNGLFFRDRPNNLEVVLTTISRLLFRILR